MVEEVDKQEIWNIVLSELELSLSKANFKTWFQNTYISQLQDNEETVIVGVPNNFSKNWLEKKYHRSILEALQGATDNKVKKVIYKVEAVTSAKELRPETIDMDQLVPEKVPETNGHGLNVRYTFKNFVVGKGSELAYAACQAIVKQPGKKYNPLFIYGGVGLGKTHLLQAIGQIKIDTGTVVKILHCAAGTLIKLIRLPIGAVHTGEFNNKCRNRFCFLNTG